MVENCEIIIFNFAYMIPWPPGVGAIIVDILMVIQIVWVKSSGYFSYVAKTIRYIINYH